MKIEIDYNEATSLIALCSVIVANIKSGPLSVRGGLVDETVSDLESIEKKCKESLRRLGKCEDADTAVEE